MGAVYPVTAAGYLERGMVLKPLVPSVSFRTQMLFPNQKKSSIVLEFADALNKERSLLAR